MKRILALSAVSCAVIIASPVVQAATSQHKMIQSSIWYNGDLLSTQSVFAASDGGNMTTYMPIFYVQQLINKALGISSSSDVWNGSAKTWTLTVSGAKPNVISQGSGVAINVNGTTIEHAPVLVDVDPSSGQSTTFMPIYYVQQLLNQVLGIPASGDVWNGNTAKWTIVTGSSIKTSSTDTQPQNSLEQEAVKVMNEITVKNNGSYRILSVPIFEIGSKWDLTVGMSDPATKKQLTIQFSTDGGETWSSTPNNYDSSDPTQGGLKSIPAGVARVLVRGPQTAVAGISFSDIGDKTSVAISSMFIQPDGTRQITWWDR